MNKKVFHKIVRKIYFENVTRCLKLIFIDCSFINLKSPCNVLNINFSNYLYEDIFCSFLRKECIPIFFFQFSVFFLTGAVFKPTCSNMA